jgi:hypothetical protein
MLQFVRPIGSMEESGMRVYGPIKGTEGMLLRQASAAVAAIMGKAKILGLIIDRREVGDVGAFDNMTDEELLDEARKRAAALGLPPSEA